MPQRDDFWRAADNLQLTAALALARRHGLAAEVAHAYRWIKPWWAFWVSEEAACLEALGEWDL